MATLLQRIGRALRLAEPKPVEDASQPQRVQIHVTEVGTTGVENFSGYYSEEYLSRLRGPQAADIWDQMRRSDPKIKMVLSAVKNPIKGAQWSVQPGDEGDNFKLHAELIEQILFKDLHQNWTQQLSEILTYLDFGFSVFEVIHKVVHSHSKFGSYNSLAKLAWRSPKTIETWNLDELTGQLKSVSQQAYGDIGKLVDIPGEFLLVFTHEKEGDNYEGISALRPCYGPWVRKNTYLKLMAVGIEKFAVPTPYMEVPEGKEQSQEYDNAKAILERYTSHQQQYITYPAGWKLGFASPSNFDASKIRDAVDRENVEIAHAFLENFLELGQSGSGSYALGNDLSDFFLLGIEHVGKNICESINRTIIPDLIKLNFGPQEVYPQLTCSGIKDKPGKEMAEILKILVDAKVVAPDLELEKAFREKYGLPKKEEKAPVELVSLPTAPTPAVQASEIKKLGERGVWVASSGACFRCESLDGRVTSREPPLHDNCMCSKDYDTKQLAETSDFCLVYIDVQKAAALSQEDAKNLAREIVTLPSGVLVQESDLAYRIQLMDPSLVVEGSLKSFESMEGVSVHYGKVKPLT